LIHPEMIGSMFGVPGSGFKGYNCVKLHPIFIDSKILNFTEWILSRYKHDEYAIP